MYIFVHTQHTGSFTLDEYCQTHITSSRAMTDMHKYIHICVYIYSYIWQLYLGRVLPNAYHIVTCCDHVCVRDCIFLKEDQVSVYVHECIPCLHIHWLCFCMYRDKCAFVYAYMPRSSSTRSQRCCMFAIRGYACWECVKLSRGYVWWACAKPIKWIMMVSICAPSIWVCMMSMCEAH